MKNKFTDIETDLNEKDLSVLLKDIRMATKMLYIMLAVNLVLAIAFLVFFPHPMALIISLMLAIAIIVMLYVIQKKSNNIQSTKKRVITGTITDMQMDFPGSTVEYKVNKNENTVHIKIRKPSGFEERTEPLELAPGEKDDFLYYLFFDTGRLNVAREIFFTFNTGDIAEIDIAQSGYILNYQVVH